MKIDNKKIESIIFDMDGLMFDTERLAGECWEKAGKKFGYNIDKKIYERIIGLNFLKSKEIYLSHFGESFPFEEIRNERIRIANEEIISNGLPIKDGLFELLDFIRRKKLKIALATSTEKKRTDFLLDLSKTKKYFDIITYGDEVANGKPDPEIFLITSKKLKSKPGKCIVLEDSEHGIIAAYEAGMLPIMVPDVIKPNEKLNDKIFKIFNTLNDVKNYFENCTI